MARQKLVTPLIYYGGKSKLADDILEVIPPHTTWIDCFGGGGAITIKKKPSEREVYNDVGFVTTFFKVLRDKPDELYRRLMLTPWSRTEFENCLNWRNVEDDIEKARMWFTCISQSFTHEETATSWLIHKGTNPASAFSKRVDLLPKVAERFRDIVIECRSFEELIVLYDHPNVLWYFDPPYMSETRVKGGGGYENEMTYQDHELLLQLANACQGQAIISGYPNPLYEAYLKDWRLKKVIRPSAIHNGSTEKKADRIECIWIKEHESGLWGQNEPVQTSKRSNVPDVLSKDFRQENLFV